MTAGAEVRGDVVEVDPSTAEPPPTSTDGDTERGPGPAPHAGTADAGDTADPGDTADASTQPAEAGGSDGDSAGDEATAAGRTTALTVPTATGARPDDGDDAVEPAPPTDLAHREATRSRLPAGYTPPPSPAYAPRPAPVVTRYTRAGSDRSAGTREPAPGAADAGASPRDRQGRPGRRLLGIGLAVALIAVAIALVTTVRGGDGEAYAFGEITAVSGGATVRTDDADSAARPIEQGETVRAGWVVEAPGDASATVSLSDGGIVRVGGGGRVTFTDLAADTTPGGTSGTPEPAIRVTGGRVWVNPGGSRRAIASGLQVQIPDARITSTGNPVALDCAAACTVEAPAGGASLSTAGGAEMHPAAGETVTFQPPAVFDLAVGDGPSAWARQNLEADATAGLPEPRPDDAPGIRASAVVDGTYSIVIGVVGPPEGDAIPRALQYSDGETYALDLVTDGSNCTPGSCTAAVSAIDAATGTASVSDGSISLELVQPIDCYDESYTTVVVPGIGTTRVEATMAVDEVDHDGVRWLVRSFSGTGTVAASLTTRCNPGDVLGTATSPITIAGS